MVVQVGFLSESYVHLARLTANASWLRAAHLFERTCFVGALALAGHLHAADAAPAEGAADDDGGAADADFRRAAADFAAGASLAAARGAAEAAQSEQALRGMHANGNIACVPRRFRTRACPCAAWCRLLLGWRMGSASVAGTCKARRRGTPRRASVCRGWRSAHSGARCSKHTRARRARP